jgi:hypothetical protein
MAVKFALTEGAKYVISIKKEEQANGRSCTIKNVIIT